MPLQILKSDDAVESNKRYVQNELARLESGASKAYSMEEVDRILEETIRKYER